jgi:hypothetical protein
LFLSEDTEVIASKEKFLGGRNEDFKVTYIRTTTKII